MVSIGRSLLGSVLRIKLIAINRPTHASAELFGSNPPANISHQKKLPIYKVCSK